tara:strand:+ start:85 stop:594 length:510 start_codon:yes stop_codon:yes gene_type:complete
MPHFQNTPLHRHEALAPFSRDHYTGLVQSQRLIKAAAQDAVARRKAVADFVDAWDHDIAEHFRDEERLLMPFMMDADRDALLDQHRQLTGDAESLRLLRRATDPDAGALAEVGRRLEKHIRWEERELFARLQEQLGPAQIDELQKRTAGIESSRPRTTQRKHKQEGAPS